MNEFDQKAQTWDINPMHLERSLAIADLVLKIIPLRDNMSALEYGAGTGMLSLLLKDHLGEITLMDSSQGMIDIIENKIAQDGIENLKPVYLDLEKTSFSGEFDFIFTQMVLHHVADIDGILRKFHGLLKPGGFLAIADLYSEDGNFHGEGFSGHKGFDPVELSERVVLSGFRNVEFRECFVIKKKLENGNTSEYPVFLMNAIK